MNSSKVSTISNTKLQQQEQHKQHHLQLCKRRGGDGGRGSLRIKKCPPHLLAYSIVPLLFFLCWLPDFIVALKDVSVTIPQAVKRGSNAMLTCNYDMENDTLYSVKWYKGRREFYRYTPKENPAMKVFPSQSGLNVERNLSNQSHVVLLAVPLNISGKFTCEISVEAPSFQTAMVSGEMEVVELPEEQATVTGIQPRYRIGDLVDGNCSIKYSKPAANLTWTINGIVVPPHHIKTYQIEKYEETNLESVMSAIHFMVTTQHFIKGQMRLKCTASIFDIFKEEIESIIEEDRPRIMASGQSYPSDHSYGTHSDSDGYEHNESYLTYFSAPKSSASSVSEFVMAKILKILKKKILENLKQLLSFAQSTTQNVLASTLVNNIKNTLDNVKFLKIKTTHSNVFHLIFIKLIITTFIIQLMKVKSQESQNSYQDANNNEECQDKYGQREKQQQYNEHCLEANQNVVNEKVFQTDTNIITAEQKQQHAKNKNIVIQTATTSIDCQHYMSQTFDSNTIHSTNTPTLPAISCAVFPSLPSTWLSLPTTLGYGKTYAHDSFPLYGVDASKRNNAKYMSKDQTLLMTPTASTTTASVIVVIIVIANTSNSTYKTPSPPKSTSARALVLESKLLSTSVQPSLPIVETSVPSSQYSYLHSYPLSSSMPSPTSFSRNNYLMAFIGELLLHQC
ncbi:beaten path Ic [Cochliomyia hominivorax]